MKIRNITLATFAAALCLSAVAPQVNAQSSQTTNQDLQPKPSIVSQAKADAPRVAVKNNLQCAGYISTSPVSQDLEIVGGEEEQDQYVYSQNNIIYISGGASKGMRENAVYSVIRPVGSFRSPFSKKGKLGIFVNEIGTVRVVKLKSQVAVAMIENSCETILLGDLLVPKVDRIAPLSREEKPLDRFAEPNGKPNGRLVLSRSGLEMPTRDQIVYVDLGVEDNVKNGDYLTIYRRLGKGNLIDSTDEEVVRPEDLGYESFEFRGGKFSNQAPRRRGENADGKIVTTPNAKKRRPRDLRKIVGEMVVINVQQRTATAVITRTAQEVHTGDGVEVQ
ncbi:MAG: hypothetical protein H7Z37_08630 [Pyrinomonadaceae bacterium]|nr:hypothetical protein [Pyrinomonadaceae bacterium]